jgi:hypothetical protein
VKPSRTYPRLLACPIAFALIGCDQIRVQYHPEDTVTAKIREGSKFCSEVRIPRAWSAIPNPLGASGIYGHAANDSGFLFSLQNPTQGMRQATVEKYWIDLVHRGQIRSATEEEWNAAPEILGLVGSYAQLKWDGPAPKGLIKKDGRRVSFNGVQFAKAGDIWGGPILSPGDKYIELSSFDGFWADGKAANDGHYFIDIHEVQDGRRIAAIRGEWRHYDPMGAIGGFDWISRRDLVFLYGAEARNLIVCRLD